MRLALVIALLLASIPARGADKKVVLVLRPQGMRQLTQGLQMRLEQKGYDLFVAEPPVSRPLLTSSATRARALFEEARTAYRSFEHQRALEILERSRAALHRGCGGADVSLLRSQSFLLGLIHFTAHQHEAARRAFSQVAALEPTWTPDAQQVAPKIVAAYEQARAALGSPVGLHLSGSPQGAVVYLDGREVGTLPLLVEDVHVGQHCIVVEALGHQPTVIALAVARQTTATWMTAKVALFPEGWSEGDPWPGATAVLVVDADQARVLADGPPVALSCVEASCLAEGVLAATQTQTATVAVPVEIPVALEPASAWYETWWVWAIIGGVVVAGVGASAHALSGDEDPSPGYRVIVTPPSR